MSYYPGVVYRGRPEERAQRRQVRCRRTRSEDPHVGPRLVEQTLSEIRQKCPRRSEAAALSCNEIDNLLGNIRRSRSQSSSKDVQTSTKSTPERNKSSENPTFSILRPPPPRATPPPLPTSPEDSFLPSFKPFGSTRQWSAETPQGETRTSCSKINSTLFPEAPRSSKQPWAPDQVLRENSIVTASNKSKNDSSKNCDNGPVAVSEEEIANILATARKTRNEGEAAFNDNFENKTKTPEPQTSENKRIKITLDQKQKTTVDTTSFCPKQKEKSPQQCHDERAAPPTRPERIKRNARSQISHAGINPQASSINTHAQSDKPGLNDEGECEDLRPVKCTWLENPAYRPHSQLQHPKDVEIQTPTSQTSEKDTTPTFCDNQYTRNMDTNRQEEVSDKKDEINQIEQQGSGLNDTAYEGIGKGSLDKEMTAKVEESSKDDDDDAFKMVKNLRERLEDMTEQLEKVKAAADKLNHEVEEMDSEEVDTNVHDNIEETTNYTVEEPSDSEDDEYHDAQTNMHSNMDITIDEIVKEKKIPKHSHYKAECTTPQPILIQRIHPPRRSDPKTSYTATVFQPIHSQSPQTAEPTKNDPNALGMPGGRVNTEVSHCDNDQELSSRYTMFSEVFLAINDQDRR